MANFTTPWKRYDEGPNKKVCNYHFEFLIFQEQCVQFRKNYLLDKHSKKVKIL